MSIDTSPEALLAWLEQAVNRSNWGADWHAQHGDVQSTQQCRDEAARWEALAALVRALTSIANNSCCDGCLEARRVARNALSLPAEIPSDVRAQSKPVEPAPEVPRGFDELVTLCLVDDDGVICVRPKGHDGSHYGFLPPSDRQPKPEGAPAASRVEPLDEEDIAWMNAPMGPIGTSRQEQLEAEVAALRAELVSAEREAHTLSHERDAALARAAEAEQRAEALERRRQRDLVEWYRLSTGVYDMRGQIQQVEAALAEARQLIQQVEWDGGNEDFLGGWCPWCRGSREMMYGSSGHEPDCPAFGQQTTQPQTGAQP